MLGFAQERARIFSLHPSRSPALSRIHPPQCDFRPHILLFNVRTSLSLDYIDTKLLLARHRIPKSALPVHEVLVASLASVLGGFGVVALFCSVGVYV